MMEPLRKYESPDVPDYSSYPAEPVRVSAEVVEFGVVSEFDALPQQASAAMYDEPARRMGMALGRFVNSVQNMFKPVRGQLQAQYARVEDEVTLAKEAAEQAYEDATRKLGKIARKSVCEARARAKELGSRAVRTVDEYPVHTLAAAGIAGVAIGIGLRAWKESHD